MAKKNELPAIIASLFVTLAVLGGGAWFLLNQAVPKPSPNPNSPEEIETGGLEIPVSKADGSSGVALVPNPSASRQRGLDALAERDYETAKSELTAALAENRNDPEARIYLNNAEIGKDESYSVALVVPANNPDATQELMRGAAQAQTEINADNGINGTPLKLLVINDDDEKEMAAEVAANLVDEKSVLGVVGHFSSGTTLAAVETYENAGLTMISPTSTSVAISEAGDYIFRTVPSDRIASATLADYAINQLETKKAAVFYNGENDYTKSVRKEFVQEIVSDQGDIVAEFDITASGFNVTEAMREVEAQGAEVIMMALTLTPLDVPLQIISLNRRSLPLLGGDALYSPKILNLGGENAVGLVVAVPWHILNHQQSSFVQEAQQLWGADVNWRTVTAYDAVHTLAAGLSEDPTRKGVARALSESGFIVEGATESVRFIPTSGDRSQSSQLVEVVSGNRSGTGFDFEPVD